MRDLFDGRAVLYDCSSANSTKEQGPRPNQYSIKGGNKDLCKSVHNARNLLSTIRGVISYYKDAVE